MAALASPARAASITRRPAVTTASRTGRTRGQRRTRRCRPGSTARRRPPGSNAMAPSASPCRTASANAAMPPPKRCTWRKSTMPSPMVVPAGAGDVGTRLSRPRPARRAVGRINSPRPPGRRHRPAPPRPPPRPAARGRRPGPAGRRAHRLDQLGHQRQRHHRCLVDDDHVVGQPVAPVVTETVVAVGTPAEQPVQRRGARRQQPRPGPALDIERRPPRRVRPPPAGRRPCRSARPARRAVAGPAAGLLIEQGQDPGHGRGLPRTRAAGDHREPAQHRGGRRQPLKSGVRRPEQPGQSRGQHRPSTPAAPASGSGRRGPRPPGAPHASTGPGTAACRPVGAGGRRVRPPLRPRAGWPPGARPSHSVRATATPARRRADRCRR